MKNLGRALIGDIRVNILIVLMLALGLSVNTTVFSVVNGLLLKPLPYVEPEKLVFINRDETSGPAQVRCRPRPPNALRVPSFKHSFSSFTITGMAVAHSI